MTSPLVKKVPSRLDRDTIVEAVFEVRFDLKESETYEVLLGLIYSEYRQRAKPLQALPITNLPKQILQHEVNLRFMAHHRIELNEFAISIGPNVMVVHNFRPYQGWEKFRGMIQDAVRVLNKTDLLAAVNRYSVRYTNLIPDNEGDWREHFKLKLDYSALDKFVGSSSLKSEFSLDEYINIVQIQNNATVTQNVTGEVVKGTYFDIDVIHQRVPADFASKLKDYLEEIHLVEKQVFFSLLSESTCKKLGPHWE